MTSGESDDALGYVLETTRSSTERHRLAGPRSAYPSVTFTPCPGCGTLLSLVYWLDFSDPRLAQLGIWNGTFVALTCHRGCAPADDASVWWDYSDPMAPSVVSSPLIAGAAPAMDFEQLPLALLPRSSRRAGKHKARVGGEPGFHQLDIIAEELGWAPPIPPCRRCGQTMPLIAQWTESFRRIPRAVSTTTRPSLGVVDASGRIRVKRTKPEPGPGHGQSRPGALVRVPHMSDGRDHPRDGVGREW